MTVGYKPGDRMRKFLKTKYDTHKHDVTHATCLATGAIYASETPIESTNPKTN
jgi:hypothetical protein